ncbi:MAG: PTS glucose transporter subunit IIA [Pseudomonadota bacterium]
MFTELFPIFSPASGRIVQTTEPPSPMATNQIFGDGPLLEISGSKLYAPFDGKVSAISASGDFIRLSHDSGFVLTLIIGSGREFSHNPAFQRLVKEHQAVKGSQPLLAINQPLLRAGNKQQRYLTLLLEVPTQVASSEFRIRWRDSGSVSAKESPIFELEQESK